MTIVNIKMKLKMERTYLKQMASAIVQVSGKSRTEHLDILCHTQVIDAHVTTLEMSVSNQHIAHFVRDTTDFISNIQHFMSEHYRKCTREHRATQHSTLDSPIFHHSLIFSGFGDTFVHDFDWTESRINAETTMANRKNRNTNFSKKLNSTLWI